MGKKYISNNLKLFTVEGCLFYVCTFILFFLQDRFCALTTDDIFYLAIGGMSGGVDGVYTPVSTLGDIITSQVYDYTHVNGRFIVHCITIWFCRFAGLNLFRIVNTLFFVLLVWNIDRILRYNRYESPYNKYIVAFCLFFLFPVTGEILIGHVATCVNYLWVAWATTSFLILLYKSHGRAYGMSRNALLFVTAAVIGSLQESFSIGMSAALFLYFCFHYDSFRQSNKFLVFGYWIGTCVLVLAPGNFARLHTVDAGSSFGGVVKILINVGNLVTSSTMLLVMLAALAVFFYVDRTGCKKFLNENLVLILAIVFCSLIVAVIFTGPRQYMSIELFSLIIVMKLVHISGILNKRKLRRGMLGVMSLYAAVLYPYVYVNRQRLYDANMDLQNSEVTDGIMYQNGFTKCANETYRNPILRKFVFPEGVNVLCLSLLKSGGSSTSLVKAVLPCSMEELRDKFQRYNKNGIYHNAGEDYCIVKAPSVPGVTHVVCRSATSLLGSIRNWFLGREDYNTTVYPLTDDSMHFMYGGEKYYIFYDSHMKTYDYAFSAN